MAKNPYRRTQASALKEFTDREPFKASFDRALARLRPDQHTVLVFYGVGGIGKSALLSELERIATQPRGSSEERARPDGNAAVCWATHDFYKPEKRSPDQVLRDLSMHLHRTYGWSFPTFALAYAEHWKRVNPELPVKAETLPFVEPTDMLLGILGEVEDLKLPYVGLLTKIPVAFQKLRKAYQDWWTRHVTPELQELAALPANGDVLPFLSEFWARDVQAALQKDGRPLVIALDTYEALWEGRREAQHRFRQDQWVRKWILELPGILWLIGGRDKLPWQEVEAEGWTDDDLEQHLLGTLSDEDAALYLTRAGIADEKVRTHLVHALDGLPLHLAVSVDTYYRILEDGGTPVPANFAQTPQQVVDRFLYYLSQSEGDTLYALSAARRWDRTIFERLVTHFKTGYSVVSLTHDLVRFSFIEALPDEAGVWKMHEAMRIALADRGPITEEAHGVLFEYYSAHLQDLDTRTLTDAQRRAFTEAAYHVRHARPPEEAVDWFNRGMEVFEHAAAWSFLIPLAHYNKDWAEETLGAGHPGTFTSVDKLAVLLDSNGCYSEAELLYRRALEGREEVLGVSHPDTLTSVSSLAVLLNETGRYGEAEPLCRRALEGREEVLGVSHPDTLTSVNDLAMLLQLTQRYSEAELLYRRALEGREEVLGVCHPDTLTSVHNLAHMLQATGRYSEAEPLCRRALEGREEVLGDRHPDTLTSVNDLAAVLRAKGRYAEAEPLLRRTLEGFEHMLGDRHPGTLMSLNNLAVILTKLGRYDEAEPLYRRAISGFQYVLPLGHPNIGLMERNLEALFERMQGET